MKKLPIGLNSLEEIIKGGFIYVDKTHEIYKIITSGKYYFISRPRRFGKTLTVDTLKQIFEGNKELFKGLYIYDKWDWNKRHPVIRIDFSVGVDGTGTLEERIWQILREHEKKFGIKCTASNFANCFYELIIKAADKYGEKVVVLVDEYDKPILDNITNPPLAEEIRNVLANFYGVLKGLDEHLRFVFLTGVSKFSKVNLFSKLNNLFDITINSDFSTICGYTQDELEKYFADYLRGVDLEKVKLWYNGYSWGGEKVYNPFDILLFIANHFAFRPYWYETGTPTFLLELMKERKYYIPNLEHIEATDEVLGSFDVYTMEIEALLWQTGYLTIKGTKQLGERLKYILGYPNKEVEISLNESILKYLSRISLPVYSRSMDEVYYALESGDIEKLINGLKSLFSGIPYTNFTKNELAEYEGFYGSVLYSFFKALGIESHAEDVTSTGRIDLVVKLGERIYIFEFKVTHSEKPSDEEKHSPLKQIKEKKYADKYRAEGRELYLIGILFSSREKNIVFWEWERG